MKKFIMKREMVGEQLAPDSLFFDAGINEPINCGSLGEVLKSGYNYGVLYKKCYQRIKKFEEFIAQVKDKDAKKGDVISVLGKQDILGLRIINQLTGGINPSGSSHLIIVVPEQNKINFLSSLMVEDYNFKKAINPPEGIIPIVMIDYGLVEVFY